MNEHDKVTIQVPEDWSPQAMEEAARREVARRRRERWLQVIPILLTFVCLPGVAFLAVALIRDVDYEVGGGEVGSSALLVAGLSLGATLYFMPSVVADRHEHPNRRGIIIVNVLLGWTLIGWGVALIWALREKEIAR